jgi:poly(hydroxyalkanoate) depolymerase family esterase
MNRLTALTIVAFVSSCAPNVSIAFTSPAANTIIASKTTLGLTVDGVDNLAHVDVAAGSVRIARIGRDDLFASSTQNVPWDPSNVAAGDVTLTATAVDLDGNNVAKASLACIVRRGIGTPGGEGENGGEGEGSAGTGEGEGSTTTGGEGEGSVVVGGGEGEGEGSSTNPDPTWTPPAARAFSQVSDWPANTSGDASAPNPGNLNMYLYVPANVPRHAPVVVAMHGCTQTADAFRSTSGWDDLADQYKFYVIYPEQNAQNDSAQTGNSMHCFNWAGYYGAKMDRGQGENESIKEMVDRLTTSSTYQADSHRVFATGLSAGGAMVPLLLATWPDVFSAGAPMAGVPYGCAHDVNGAISCMHADASTEQTPAQWAALVKSASSWSGPWPRVSVWQGDGDNTVSYGNMKRIVEQWTAVHGASQTASTTDTLNGQAHATYKDSSGHVVVETVTLHGMDHGISVDPGSGADQGGSTGAFSYNEGVWSTYYAAKFFGIVDGSPVVSGEGEGEGSIASGEGEGEGSSSATCVVYATTLVMHQWAIPPRVKDVGTVLAPSYVVIGSNEAIPSTTNPYLDTVTLHSTSDTTFALGPCP